MKTDYLIVGSGLTGSVIARILSDAGKKVLVVERRAHIGGNVHDYVHACGTRIHSYGPHFFRTSSKNIWKFVNRFSRFYKYELVIKSYVDGRYENWPILQEYIERTSGKGWKPDFEGTPTNFEEVCLSIMPRVVYEKFVKGYTKKQWGVDPRTLSLSLAKRLEVRKDNDPRLKKHKYQGIPENGYSVFMTNLLSGIPVILNFDYIKNRDALKVEKMVIFTGPIDEFFSFKYGRLGYRGQIREQIYLADTLRYQPGPMVNYPSEELQSYIRTLEWKHMMPKAKEPDSRGTLITKETPITPYNPDQYEYPFPDRANYNLFCRYSRKSKSIPNLLICGRLGEYKYYDMDHAIERAMFLAKQILKKGRGI